MLIPLIRPRKVIFTGGTEAEVMKLAEECRQQFKSSVRVSDDILTPKNGERVAASMDTNAWTVKLSRDLVKKIQWQEVKGLEVVTLVGRLKATSVDDDQEIQRRKRGEVNLPCHARWMDAYPYTTAASRMARGRGACCVRRQLCPGDCKRRGEVVRG